MYYHYAVLLLFRPLVKYKVVGSSILPRDVCAQAADAIQGLLQSYSAMYTLQRTPALLPHFALAAAIMPLAIRALYKTGSMDHERTSTASKPPEEPASVVFAVRQGQNNLKEMSLHHQFAGQALESLHCLAKTWGFEPGAPDDGAPLQVRAHGTGSYTISLDFDAPNVRGEDFIRA
jgi:hypothetical protein